MIFQLTTKLANHVGLPEDQIRIIVLILFSIPLSYVLYLIQNKTLRFYYSLIVGTILQLLMYHSDYIQYSLILLQTVAVYFISKTNRGNCGLIITVESIIVMSGFHIYRQWTDYGSWKLDSTTILMNLVCKYSEFAYAYQDGASKKKLSEEQQLFKIQELPSLGDYLGYIQFLPSAIMGPSFQYKEYHNYIYRDSRIPNPLREVFKTLLVCLSFLGIYLMSSTYIGIEYMTTSQFLQSNPWYIFWYSVVSVLFAKSKYYFGWKLVSCSLHATGITYSHKNNNYDEIALCNPEIVETTVHIRERTANWNIGCQLWLKRSVYMRFGNQELYKKSKSAQSNGQLLVFAVSAFWHGFYGGYYITFFLWFVLTHLSTLIFKIVNNYPIIGKYYQKSGIFGNILLWIISNSTFYHLGTYFLLISFDSGMAVMKALHYIPPILVIVLTVVLQLSGLHIKKTKKS